jgi:SAM-dependent methyltransferase
VSSVHELPRAHHHWAGVFLLPLFAELDVVDLESLFDQCVAEQCRRCAPDNARLVSLGAGNGETELPMAKRLADRGVRNLELVLLELNESMLERALATAAELGIADRVRVQATDLNVWTATEPTDIYLAVQSLHHVVELEHLYDQVDRTLHPDGVLLVNDMIGRNGHVRWPEAAGIVRGIWELLPERYRHNNFSGQIDHDYPDWDCSGEGFEGVRSQDVLPLLLERFHPELYVTFANVIDPFVDRVYGHNFDMSIPEDVAFIETVARLDDGLLDLGVITPTHLIASFRKQPVECRYPRERSPERTVRRPGERRGADIDPAELAIPPQIRQAAERYEALRRRKAVRAALAAADLRHDPVGGLRRIWESRR